MSGAVRRKIMVGIVGFVLVWPLAHAWLVTRFHVDPWELFGWSMYAAPAARVQIRVDVERDGETTPLRAMGEARRRVRDYARRRNALGALAPTLPLARSILEQDPTIDALTITTREIVLDPETAHLVARDEVHRHERRSPGE